MYIAQPTHGARTRPKRTQLTTAARKTTLNAGQCVRQPREGRVRNRQNPPAQKKKNPTEGEGGGARKQPTATKPPANTTKGGQTPPQKTPKTGPPKRHRGTTQPKPATPSQEQRPMWKKEHRNKQTHTQKKTKKKKEPATQPERKGMGGQGPQGPGQGHPAKKKKGGAQKTHADNPAKKGWAQPRPGPSTHANTARQNRKRRGASGAPTQPHTYQKQAEAEPQPRTPQKADTRGRTPQTVPKHTHPRPQLGLAGLTKPTPNREPDPNTNAAQR